MELTSPLVCVTETKARASQASQAKVIYYISVNGCRVVYFAGDILHCHCTKAELEDV